MVGKRAGARRRIRPLSVVALLTGLAAATLAGTIAFGGANAAPEPVTSSSPAAERFVVTDRVISVQPRRDRVAAHQDARAAAHAKAVKKRKAALKRMHPEGAAQRYAAITVLKRKWPEKQFTCLVSLWNRESHWNAHAGSAEGAYGIPQAYPGTKMGAGGGDWRDDYAVQIRWGLGYVTGRYGSPCAAWAHWQANGNY